MEQEAEKYPIPENSELFLRHAAALEEEFQANSHDVIRQAEICVENGKLQALNGRHEAALNYFFEARSRYIVDREESSREMLRQIEMLIANSLRHLSHS